ncbi:hypothetical protein PWT90_08716 [Aphanocladium album]|nr:hypothetical protein PWT90_08716 [Aphanocladium album]
MYSQTPPPFNTNTSSAPSQSPQGYRATGGLHSTQGFVNGFPPGLFPSTMAPEDSSCEPQAMNCNISSAPSQPPPSFVSDLFADVSTDYTQSNVMTNFVSHQDLQLLSTRISTFEERCDRNWETVSRYIQNAHDHCNTSTQSALRSMFSVCQNSVQKGLRDNENSIKNLMDAKSFVIDDTMENRAQAAEKRIADLEQARIELSTAKQTIEELSASQRRILEALHDIQARMLTRDEFSEWSSTSLEENRSLQDKRDEVLNRSANALLQRISWIEQKASGTDSTLQELRACMATKEDLVENRSATFEDLQSLYNIESKETKEIVDGISKSLASLRGALEHLGQQNADATRQTSEEIQLETPHDLHEATASAQKPERIIVGSNRGSGGTDKIPPDFQKELPLFHSFLSSTASSLPQLPLFHSFLSSTASSLPFNSHLQFPPTFFSSAKSSFCLPHIPPSPLSMSGIFFVVSGSDLDKVLDRLGPSIQVNPSHSSPVGPPSDSYSSYPNLPQRTLPGLELRSDGTHAELAQYTNRLPSNQLQSPPVPAHTQYPFSSGVQQPVQPPALQYISQAQAQAQAQQPSHSSSPSYVNQGQPQQPVQSPPFLFTAQGQPQQPSHFSSPSYVNQGQPQQPVQSPPFLFTAQGQPQQPGQSPSLTVRPEKSQGLAELQKQPSQLQKGGGQIWLSDDQVQERLRQHKQQLDPSIHSSAMHSSPEPLGQAFSSVHTPTSSEDMDSLWESKGN